MDTAVTEDEEVASLILLDSLKRQYLQLVAPTELNLAIIPAGLLHSQDFQHRLFTDVFNPAIYNYPPPLRYTTRVVKRFITAIEDAAFVEGYGYPEIDETLIDFYTTLISQTPTSNSSTSAPPNFKSYVTYTITPPNAITATTENGNYGAIPSHSIITLTESRSVISGSGHTGARTWEAALALGELLVTSHQQRNNSVSSPYNVELRNKNVLELGAGTGFLSILAAKLGAAKVLATDGDWRVCEALKENVDQNGTTTTVEVGRLLWGSGHVYPVDLNSSDSNAEAQVGVFIPDVVLAADVTYDSSTIPSLVSELDELLTKNPKAEVLVAATIRNEDTYKTFEQELGKGLFTWKQTELVWEEGDYRALYYPTTTPIRIIHIARPVP